MVKQRKILAITGGRSDYFLMRPTYQAIMAHPQLELALVVSGAHLSPLHGGTLKDVEADGFPIVARIENLVQSDGPASRLKAAGTQLHVLSHIIEDIAPEVLLVPMDREEAITLAICAAYLYIPAVHYGAGDRSFGHVDDMVRHAASRMCHIMLTCSDDSRQRLINAGEEEWRVQNVGSCGLDRLRQTPELGRAGLALALGVERVEEQYLVVVQHPISSDVEKSGEFMVETLEAALGSGLQVFVSYPNSDSGSQLIVEVIEQYADHPRIEVFRNVPEIPFVNLLRMATCLMGNSSMGLYEGPYLRLPVINAGARQTNRIHAENVFYTGSDRVAIGRQLDLILHDESTQQVVANCNQPFGDGQSGPRIAQLLASLEINERLMNKDLTF